MRGPVMRRDSPPRPPTSSSASPASRDSSRLSMRTLGTGLAPRSVTVRRAEATGDAGCAESQIIGPLNLHADIRAVLREHDRSRGGLHVEVGLVGALGWIAGARRIVLEDGDGGRARPDVAVDLGHVVGQG